MLLKLGRVVFAFSFGSLEGEPRVLGIACNRVLGIACIQEFPLARNIVLFLRSNFILSLIYIGDKMNFVVMLLLFLLVFFFLEYMRGFISMYVLLSLKLEHQ